LKGVNPGKARAFCTCAALWRRQDEWLWHRMQVIQLKHWKRGVIMCRELRALGATAPAA